MHCNRLERLLVLLKVPAGQAGLGPWGLEEPTGHTDLQQRRGWRHHAEPMPRESRSGPTMPTGWPWGSVTAAWPL